MSSQRQSGSFEEGTGIPHMWVVSIHLTCFVIKWNIPTQPVCILLLLLLLSLLLLLLNSFFGDKNINSDKKIVNLALIPDTTNNHVTTQERIWTCFRSFSTEIIQDNESEELADKLYKTRRAVEVTNYDAKKWGEFSHQYKNNATTDTTIRRMCETTSRLRRDYTFEHIDPVYVTKYTQLLTLQGGVLIYQNTTH